MNKLSDLKLDDNFTFVAGTKAFYAINNNQFAEYLNTHCKTTFLVLKVNKQSIKCRAIDAHIEWVFKHSGVQLGYKPVYNSEIEIIKI